MADEQNMTESTQPNPAEAAPDTGVIADTTSDTGMKEANERKKFAAVGDVIVEVSAVLGKVNMPVEQFIKLGRGAIIELTRHKDENLDIYVNGAVIAKGEVMVVKDNVGISVTKVLKKGKMYTSTVN